MSSNAWKLAFSALFMTFIFSGACVRGTVTVGHSGSGANYICDGVDDGVEINEALATKQTVKLIADSPYNIGGTSITVPGNDVTYTLTANTPGNPPTIKATQNCVMINAPNAKFDISYLKFDGNGHQVSCIRFTQAWAGSRIDNCFFGGYTSSSAWTATGIYGTNQSSVLADHNTFNGGNGVSVWIEGKTDPNSRGAYAQVSYNQFLFNSNGDYSKANMAAIEGEYLHVDHNNIVSEGGEGIAVSRSWVEYNVIRGTAEIGIKVSCWPIYDTVHNGGDYATYYTDCANDAYDLIDHNIVEYSGANGIDYWYADGSVITNNRCNDNGQDASPTSLWDRDGIDCNDHSQNTQVSNNEATNKASTISDTVTAVGSNYVAVANLNRWYDYRNGAIVPFNGLNVHIGSTNNKISSVDVGAARIYLANAPTGVSIGNAMTGINEQVIGINVASNGQSLGNHHGAHNNVYGNLRANIVPTIDGSKLPNTDITSDGTGPVPPFESSTGNDAQYVSQSVPATMTVGQTYPVSVSMINTGVNAWTATGQYRLGSQRPQDNSIWGTGRVSLSSGESIAHGTTKTFSFNVVAPASPGTYNFSWRMLQESVEWFGDYTPNVLVSVVTTTTTTTTTTSTTRTTTTTTTSTTRMTASTTTTTSPTTSSTTTSSSSSTTRATTSTTSSSTTSSTSSSTTTTSSLSTTTSTSSTTTSSTIRQCVMLGNYLPCNEALLNEVLAAINQWAGGGFNLGDVVDLINSWADPQTHPPY